MKAIILIIFVLCRVTLFGQSFVSNQYKSYDTQSKQGNLFDKGEWFTVNTINLYGGGALLGLLTSKDDSEESTAPTGSLGINFSTNRLSCNLFFSYNTRRVVSMDGLSKFGNALSNPNLGGQSFSFTASNAWNKRFGLEGSLQIADNLWQTDSLTTLDASPLVARIGCYFKPFDFDPPLDQNIDFVVNMNYIHRNILGDFNNKSYFIDNYQVSRKGFNGFGTSTLFIFNKCEHV